MNTSSRDASLLTMVVLLSACAASVNDPVAPSAVMLGEWTYVSPHVVRDTPDWNAGLRVQVVIDSLDGMHFSGHVMLWFAGDVGTPPAAFGPVSGMVDGSNGVTLAIARTHAQPVVVMGEVAEGVLMVHDCYAGTESGPFAAGSVFLRGKAG